MHAPFFAVFNFIANNRIAQIVLTAGLVLVAYKIQAEHHEARGRRQANARTEKKARRVQANVRETLNEESAQVTNAVAAVRERVRATGQLPERISERFISDHGNGD